MRITEMWQELCVQGLQERQAGRSKKGVVIYVREQPGCMEPFCGTEGRVTEGLWVIIRREAGKSNTVVGICSKSILGSG